jgi:hypothetical protein
MKCRLEIAFASSSVEVPFGIAYGCEDVLVVAASWETARGKTCTEMMLATTATNWPQMHQGLRLPKSERLFHHQTLFSSSCQEL